MSNNPKKRRAGASSDGEDNNGFLVHEELKALRSNMTNMMQTMLDSNRTQMAMMSSMQGEITRLTNESNQMKQAINAMRRTQHTISENTNSRFDDVGNKQNYHELLLENQQWKYSAPRPPEEYWDGLDDEDEEVAAESFLTQIKKCTEEMRYGTGDGNINIDATLPYNEELLPHWKEFANAIEQYQYCLKCLPKDTDSKLYLWGMELPNEVVELLSNALESTHFNRFILGNNNFGRAGIDFALKYLRSNRILKKFCLYDNTINSMNDIKQICKIVKEHPSIETLSLDGCRGERVNGYEMLQMIMSAGKNKLNGLDLSDNNISTGGDTFISDFLTDNPIMETICLENNQLDDNDAIAIAGALKHNTKLRSLRLTDNNISKSGWEALRKAEFDDTSLNSAADSNHICIIWYPSGDDEIQGLDASEMNGDTENSVMFRPKYARRKKIYSVLSSRNRQCSNVGHFDDVPVEFLPRMLLRYQKYSNYHVPELTPRQDSRDVNPLSLVYEVCRYWDKSLAVYELLSS